MYNQSAVLRRHIGVVLTFVAVVLGLVAVTSVHSKAAADPYPPTAGCSVSTSDTTVQPGDTLSVTGSGFPVDSTVQLAVHSAAPVGLGSVHTDTHGSFTDTVTIPSSITGTDHRIVASSGSTTCSFDPFANVHTVNASHDNASGRTAYTGFGAVSAIVIAVVLLGGGLVLLMLGRRRSRS